VALFSCRLFGCFVLQQLLFSTEFAQIDQEKENYNQNSNTNGNPVINCIFGDLLDFDIFQILKQDLA